MALRNKQVRTLAIKLDRLKRLPQVLDDEMALIARKVQHTAKAMAPVDYGGLKASIKVRRTAATRKGVKGFIKGKSSFRVFIDPMTPAPGHKEGVVGGYAWLIHEHMGWPGVPNVIMPSPKSIAAGQSQGVDAGGKFINRAFWEHKGKVRANLRQARDKFINHADFMANRVDK